MLENFELNFWLRIFEIPSPQLTVNLKVMQLRTQCALLIPVRWSRLKISRAPIPSPTKSDTDSEWNMIVLGIIAMRHVAWWVQLWHRAAMCGPIVRNANIGNIWIVWSIEGLFVCWPRTVRCRCWTLIGPKFLGKNIRSTTSAGIILDVVTNTFAEATKIWP